jgi:hypothetical protein
MKKIITKVFFSLTVAFTILWFTNNFSYGAYLSGAAYKLYASYANDILLPFGFYFGLCALERFIPALRSWKIKAAIAFLLPSALEFLQPLWTGVIGIDFMTVDQFGLGSAFDPLDFFAYAIGVFTATLIERHILTRLSFWN